MQAVMKPNMRRARPTCKGKKRATQAPPQNPDSAVWEVSDGEMTTASWGPKSTKYKPYMCDAFCLSMFISGNTYYRGTNLR